MSQSDKPKNPNHLFGIFDTDTKAMQWINLAHLANTNNFVHGMGICYNNNYFCAGIIPIRERLASNIFTINLKTGEKKITYLHFTKAVHGMTSIDDNRLLVNATQTDCIVELCLKNGWIVTEDLYHHFLDKEVWEKQRLEICNKLDQPINYRGFNYVDDHTHNNSVIKHNDNIYATLFNKKMLEQGENTSGGVMINLMTQEPIINNLKQPHTAFVDSKGDFCCCSSSEFTFVVKDKFKIELDGYTRGICEDQKRGGYWVGISAYRKYNAKLSKWIERYPGEHPLKGARIQFIDYEGNIKDTIDLTSYGKEIFDLLPFRQGKWN